MKNILLVTLLALSLATIVAGLWLRSRVPVEVRVTLALDTGGAPATVELDGAPLGPSPVHGILLFESTTAPRPTAGRAVPWPPTAPATFEPGTPHAARRGSTSVEVRPFLHSPSGTLLLVVRAQVGEDVFVSTHTLHLDQPLGSSIGASVSSQWRGGELACDLAYHLSVR